MFFSAFARFAGRCTPSTVAEFLLEPILFHPRIKVGGVCLSDRSWRIAGISNIGQLLNENLEFLDFQTFVRHFGNHVNFVKYHGAHVDFPASSTYVQKGSYETGTNT